MKERIRFINNPVMRLKRKNLVPRMMMKMKMMKMMMLKMQTMMMRKTLMKRSQTRIVPHL